MKKIISHALLVVCMTSVVLAGAEKADGSMDAAWTFGFLLLPAASAWGWHKMNKSTL